MARHPVVDPPGGGCSICRTGVTDRRVGSERHKCAAAMRGLFRARRELFRSVEPRRELTVRAYSQTSVNEHKNKNCTPAHRSPVGSVKGGPMAHLELSAHMTVRPGCLEGFKKQAAELIRITKEKDTHTLRYDWF